MPRQTKQQKQQGKYLKIIVAYCISFISAVIIVGIIAAFYGIEISYLLTATCGVFGGQLLLSCVLKLVGAKKVSTSSDDDEAEDG